MLYSQTLGPCLRGEIAGRVESRLRRRCAPPFDDDDTPHTSLASYDYHDEGDEMFFNQDLLTRRGPLARVWLAAHVSTKLSKSNLIATDIPQSVQSILGDSLVSMALRLSGQLLLGVTRIYSRQAKYLLDDCNDAVARVKRTFRPGAHVDLDQPAAEAGKSREAVTMRQAEGGALEDILNTNLGGYWCVSSICPHLLTAATHADVCPCRDMNFDAFSQQPQQNAVASTSAAGVRQSHIAASSADITLRDDFGAFDLNANDLGFGDDAFAGFGVEGWGDEDALDLGLVDEATGALAAPSTKSTPRKRKRAGEGDDDDESVELGRDAPASVERASARGSIADDFAAGDNDDLLAMGDGFPDNNNNYDKAGGDFGGFGDNTFDFGYDDHADLLPQHEPVPEDGDANATPKKNVSQSTTLGLTPKTAAALAKGASPNKRQKLSTAARKQVVDKETQLDLDSMRQKENQFVEPRFLPRSRHDLRLLEIANDPAAYYLPRAVEKGKDKYVISAPPGLAPELEELFMFPSRDNVGRGASVAPSVANADDLDVELGRRASGAPDLDGFGGGGFPDAGGFDTSFGFGADNGADETGLGGFDTGFDDALNAAPIQFDDDGLPIQPGGDDAGLAPSQSKRAKGKGKAVAEETTPFEDDEEEDETAGRVVSKGPLAVFDTASATARTSSTSASQAQQQTSTQSHSLDADEEEDALAASSHFGADDKVSRNTVKALGVLRDEFQGETGRRTTFQKLGQDVRFLSSCPPSGSGLSFGLTMPRYAQATRRAAAAMFHEVLLLKTKDVIDVAQAAPYADITIMSKAGLF